MKKFVFTLLTALAIPGSASFALSPAPDAHRFDDIILEIDTITAQGVSATRADASELPHAKERLKATLQNPPFYCPPQLVCCAVQPIPQKVTGIVVVRSLTSCFAGKAPTVK